jgi:hypothetical protein
MFWKNWKKKQPRREKFKCARCGKYHDELPALGFLSPIYFAQLSEQEKEDMADLSDDFCVIKHPDQTDRFIRTTLTIPIHDACEDLDYGIWASLSEKSFEEYRQEFGDNIEGKIYFGRICNVIDGYEESTIGLHVNVETRAGGARPKLVPHASNHQLVREWENGISMKEAVWRIEKAYDSIG